ncbi:MAG: hypothetical protein H6595_02065 [Flavobacteriales bacterium]|nr:hypothetical protein [Flavobacteriales bacterium]
MRTLTLATTLVLLTPFMPWTGGSLAGPESDLPGNPTPGFTMALFDAASLNGLLDNPDCTGIRFYNAMASLEDQDGTVVAIGISADGNELSGGTPYILYSGMARGIPMMQPMSQNAAATACGNMTKKGHASYSASFTKADLLALLTVDRCQALRVVPDMCDNGNTMRVSAVAIEDGAPVELGEGEGYERSCGDPCPTVCGPAGNYINSK